MKGERKMAAPLDSIIQSKLLELRQKLEESGATSPSTTQFSQLMYEVDAALERLNKGTYGLCKTCNETIEMERLATDPLVRYCLDHMTPSQKSALEEDLQLAAQIQKALLPPQRFSSSDWDFSYFYEGAHPVSGDYCDLIRTESDQLYFIVGDVKGKGIAASMLTAHLHATFRALVSLGLPLNQLMSRASRAFCESSLPAYFATLICGKTSASGEVEICNAGHPPPFLVQQGEILQIGSHGLPIGMFCDEQFTSSTARLSPGDIILLYTDGLTESKNASGDEYGNDRLAEFIQGNYQQPPTDLLFKCIENMKKFRAGTPTTDDLTVMVIQRRE